MFLVSRNLVKSIFINRHSYATGVKTMEYYFTLISLFILLCSQHFVV